MDHEETVCPNCQKVTKTILGGCPNCGGPKEEPVYFPPQVAASGSWFDDLPHVLIGGTAATILLFTAVVLALVVGWEWGLAALAVLGLVLYGLAELGDLW
jgi:hypothetical protein